MATQTLQIDGVPGETGTTLLVYPITSDTLDDSVAAAEATNRNGIYVGAFTDLPAGSKRVELQAADGSLLSVGYYVSFAVTATYTCVSTAPSVVADAVLTQSVAGDAEDNADAHSLAMVVLGMLESSRSGSTWTIKKSDGATTKATKTLTLDALAEPVVGVD